MWPYRPEYVQRLSGNRRPKRIGAKAMRLRELLGMGIPLPVTYACGWEAHARYLSGDERLVDRIRAELTAKLDLTRKWAVRSSADIEDGLAHSFAGQFASVLNASGLDALLAAIQTVWDSARAPGVQAYLEKAGVKAVDVKMAVIIQEMVEPVVSGVSFSKNPVTGLDEVVVEAVPGPGTALVQEGVTPQRWVYKWGKWLDEPNAPVIDRDAIEAVVSQTQSIARACGRPVDLEWVYDGATIHWVQLRPITGLGRLNVYTNRISREVLPGVIKPLVWSVNVPLVNGAWIRLFSELIGPNDLRSDDLAKAFYFRAYFNMGAIGRIFDALGMPPATLELLMGLEGGEQRPRFRPSRRALKHAPRLLRFLIRKLRFGREVEAFLPASRDTYRRYADQSLETLDERGLVALVDELYAFNQRAVYFNVVGPLLMYAYHAGFRRRLAAIGIAPDRFDLARGLAGWREYNPNVHLSELNRQFRALSADAQSRIRRDGYAALQSPGEVRPFGQAVAAFLSRFGHFSDSGNDFSRVPWRDRPDFVLQMIVDFHQPESAATKIGWDDLPAATRRSWRLRFLHGRARQFSLYREAIGFYYTLGYGLFRNLFLELEARLTRRGVLSSAEDIFYLDWSEVRRIVAEGERAQSVAALVDERRRAVESAQDAVLPDIIYGDQVPPAESVGEAREKLVGIPTSRGYYRGRVRVVRSIEHFDRVEAGSVIVIPYSDVSWTPLIAKAGAVVAESGGTLSHSSIVAREYNLPAVVSVTHACRLLRDDMIVTVDGFKGEIILHRT
jgi:pyruvate,water dikinase